MKIVGIEIKQDKNGKDYKQAKLSEQVHGKDKFNIFPRHTRYSDVVVEREFSPSDFVQNGQYIEMVDPNKGMNTRYPNKPSSGCFTETDRELLQMIHAILVRLDSESNIGKPPF